MASFRKRGGVWHVQVRRNGYPSQTKTFKLKSDADQWVRRIERQIDLGEPVINSVNGQSLLLRELLERYRDEVSINKRRYDSEMWRINAMCRHWLGKCHLRHLSPELISKYRDERLTQVAGASVLQELQLIKHCLKIAINEWGAPLSINPTAGIRFPSPGKARERRLNPGELQRLMKGCEQGRTPLLAPIIEFAVETGMRRGEIVNIKRCDVNVNDYTLLIPISKNGESRTIPLTPRALCIVNSLQKSNEDVFPISANALKLAWQRLKKRVGITDLRFHDLRHEAVSRFFEMGLSVPEVALISGHRDIRMLFRYTHLKPVDVGEKLNALSESKL